MIWHLNLMTLSFAGYAKLYAVALVVFFAMDLLWLGVVARTFYTKHLGFLMREQALWPAALAFYALFLLGMVVFVIGPAVEANSIRRALVLGVFYGFITYQTYELTNYALLKNWPPVVVVVDIAWGMVLSGVVAVLTTWAARRWL